MLDNWRTYEGQNINFFETEKGGRLLRVGVNFTPEDQGNILWYLVVITKDKHYARFYLTLDDMKQLSKLFSELAEFCKKTMYFNQESVDKILQFRREWGLRKE
jgi:uncharacterized protein with ACT and thioredoxin-like domain